MIKKIKNNIENVEAAPGPAVRKKPIAQRYLSNLTAARRGQGDDSGTLC